MLEQYFKDFKGCELLYHPSEMGFVAYKIKGNELLIDTLIVDKDHWSKGIAVWLGTEVEKLAVASGCTHLSCVCTLDPEHPEHCTRNLKIFLQYGFRSVNMVGDNQLILIKELNG